jgi:hypothetical protein
MQAVEFQCGIAIEGIFPAGLLPDAVFVQVMRDRGGQQHPDYEGEGCGD